MSSIQAELGTLDYISMAADQQHPDIQACRTAISNLQLEDIPIGNSQTKLLCDVSTGTPRPIVPPSWRSTVFHAIHSHPSIRITRKLVASKFVWHGLNKQIGLWTKQCIACQKSKIQRHVKSPVTPYPLTNARFQHINIDIVGPLPSSQGHRYRLTMVDRFTRWPEAVPLKDATAHSCAQAFLATWISRFGIPAHLSSDRGPQFTSAIWASLYHALGIHLHHTTAFHPQANGLVERFHRHLKSALMARLTGPDWVAELLWVLLGIRTAPKEDLNCSSAELVYGTPLSVPGDFWPSTAAPSHSPDSAFLPWLRGVVQKQNPIPMSRHGSTSTNMPPELTNCLYVFLRQDSHRRPLAAPYEGPFKVLQRGAKSFQIDIGGRTETVSVDRLKPAHVDITQPVTVAPGKRRGRPPRQ